MSRAGTATQIQRHFLSADELGDLLAHIIQGAAGGTEVSWHKVIGQVERMPTWQMVSHNWRVGPKGNARQQDIVERAVAIVQAEHPYVS